MAEEVLAIPKIPVPGDVELRMKRGRDAMREGAPKRNECLAHARGDQYKYLDAENKVVSQPTTTRAYEGQSGKAPHRVRRVRNFIFDIVETEVAAAMQRLPGYSVLPSGPEAKKIAAARRGRKLLYYGYDKWGIRKARERAIRYAIVADEGFAWPYFDNSIGPYMTEPNPETGKPETIGQGEIRIRIYGPNETYWEPGLKFEDSPWYGIEQARDIASVMQTNGYLGGKLDADAQNAESEKDESPNAKLVMVKDYLERPSPVHPEGRWLTIANGRLIAAERPYPCQNAAGKVLDEPVLHKLTYSMDPDSDRDEGLVRHLLDPQRAVNHATSKQAEWVNLTLSPQFIVQNGKLKQKRNDMPGMVYNAVGTGTIQVIQPGPVPPELAQIKAEAVQDMARIAAQNDIPSQVESGRGIEALLEKDNSRRANFLGNLAEFDSRLGRHCLYLAQRHYTEPRLIQAQGSNEIGQLKDFLGAELYDETDVRVDPDSLEPITREGMEKKVMAFAERGWISPHAAMAAINNGTAENLVESYERDVARANLVIQKVMEGPEVLFDTQPRRPFPGEDPGFEELPNEETGEVEMVPRETVPGWMPRPFDNEKVQKDCFEDWMKSTEYDELDPPSQEAINTYYDALLQQEAKKAADAAMAQEQTAESLGMNNAAKPTGPPPLPDQAPIPQG